MENSHFIGLLMGIYRTNRLPAIFGEKDEGGRGALHFVELCIESAKHGTAERPIAAKRGTDEIVIEIKSFLSPSVMRDLQQALGQYILYRTILTEIAPEKRLYLAIRDTTYERLQAKPVFTLIQSQSNLQIIVVNTEREEIIQWIV